jgi:hypothetical protein
MVLERITYLYYPLALYINLVRDDKGFLTKAVLNPREDKRADLIIFNKLIKVINTGFK